jgi:ABC-type transport system involved in multi-copper enzyme maturation permease subunit
MMLSTSFGHADVLLWFIEIFLFVVWFWLLITIFSDLFRDHEVSGVAKALWVVFVLLFPFVGVLAYLILRGGGMSARAARSMRETQERFDTYVRSVAGTAQSPAEQIEKAKALLDRGAIDRAEFDRLKAKALQ